MTDLTSTAGPIPARELQAIAEVGHTDVRPRTALTATLLFLAVIGAVPIVQLAVNARSPERSLLDPLPELTAGLGRAVAAAPTIGLFAANRDLLATIDGFETRLEETSMLRGAVLPWGQWVLTRFGGVGNEQAYVGREGWLFYRPDVDHVTGPGFLEPRVLAKRALGGEVWEARPQPDPLPVLIGFGRELAARGVDLVLLPVPAKPAIQPERLSRRYRHDAAPLTNPSFSEWRERLTAGGIEVLDPGPILAELGASEPAYLPADTHWTPAAMERVAEDLARRLAPRLSAAASGAGYWRREATIASRGDVVAMLRLPAERELYPETRMTVHPVLDADGAPWRPRRDAEVLLLGDSFTNVFSDPALGWGGGAGLAEQLAHALDRPVDRIAQNAGGAWTTRQALAREIATDPTRLAGVRVVVYQFAARELSFGDWKAVELP